MATPWVELLAHLWAMRKPSFELPLRSTGGAWDNARMSVATYQRIQARYCGRLGVEVGIFVAVDHLRRAGKLDEEQLATYLDIDDWFHEHLPEPHFYEDGNSVGAVTWFKTPIPENMSTRVQRLTDVLRAHGVEYDLVSSDDPGRILYEDDFQVGVVPYSRKPQTLMPETETPLGPTTARSKRNLPHGPAPTS